MVEILNLDGICYQCWTQGQQKFPCKCRLGDSELWVDFQFVSLPALWSYKLTKHNYIIYCMCSSNSLMWLNRLQLLLKRPYPIIVWSDCISCIMANNGCVFWCILYLKKAATWLSVNLLAQRIWVWSWIPCWDSPKHGRVCSWLFVHTWLH